MAHSKATKNKIRETKRLRPFVYSEELRKKMSDIQKELSHKYWLGKSRPEMIGEKNPNWKGNDIGYRGIHAWIQRKLGKPPACSFEDASCRGRFEWANLDGKYQRDLDTWMSLCKSHHWRLDNNKI